MTIDSLDSKIKRCGGGEWKFPTPEEEVKYWGRSWLWLGDHFHGSLYLFRSKSGGRWNLFDAPCSDLIKHTCYLCGRRGKAGFIHDEYMSELHEIKALCFGCRSKRWRFMDKERECVQLISEVKRHIKTIKRMKHESTKDNT